MLAGCVAALVAGCAGKKTSPQPVSGQVLVDGKPAPRAQVTFHPTDDKNPARPTGQVDEQGRFTLTTERSGDGAPSGEYRVTVVWFVASPLRYSGDESVSRNV